MMASCQATRLPLALIFCAKLMACGVVTVTVKLGLLTVLADRSSAAHAMLVIPSETHTQTAKQPPTFFMTLLVVERPVGVSRV
jgi:hypothetical protein